MKTCTACGVEQPEEKFKIRSGRQNHTRFSMCNACLYLRYTKPGVEKKTAIIQQYKVDTGCVDCGYNTHAEALHFDHRPGEVKCFNIGEQIGNRSMEALWAEIAKCDVRCANCHAVMTASRRLEVAV